MLTRAPRDHDTLTVLGMACFRNKILQLETIIAAAMKDFSKVVSIKVPRSRYLPVKSTSDLFLIQSNLYSVSRGMMIMNPAR